MYTLSINQIFFHLLVDLDDLILQQFVSLLVSLYQCYVYFQDNIMNQTLYIMYFIQKSCVRGVSDINNPYDIAIKKITCV